MSSKSDTLPNEMEILTKLSRQYRLLYAASDQIVLPLLFTYDTTTDEVLEIEPSATQSQIRTAYKR